MAFIKEDVVFKVVFPLVSELKSTFVGITSPDSKQENYVNKLAKKTDASGNSIFKIVRIVSACDECIKSGCKFLFAPLDNLPLKVVADCPHFMQPHWLGAEKQGYITITSNMNN